MSPRPAAAEGSPRAPSAIAIGVTTPSRRPGAQGVPPNIPLVPAASPLRPAPLSDSAASEAPSASPPLGISAGSPKAARIHPVNALGTAADTDKAPHPHHVWAALRHALGLPDQHSPRDSKAGTEAPMQREKTIVNRETSHPYE
jgi:hypothetical protein